MTSLTKNCQCSVKFRSLVTDVPITFKGLEEKEAVYCFLRKCVRPGSGNNGDKVLLYLRQYCEVYCRFLKASCLLFMTSPYLQKPPFSLLCLTHLLVMGRTAVGSKSAVVEVRSYCFNGSLVMIGINELSFSSTPLHT